MKIIPDSPGVRSDVVSLGSRAGPAPSPAHSSASELAAPVRTGDTNCILSKVFLHYSCLEERKRELN